MYMVYMAVPRDNLASTTRNDRVSPFVTRTKQATYDGNSTGASGV
jgi:hypothetical protein